MEMLRSDLRLQGAAMHLTDSPSWCLWNPGTGPCCDSPGFPDWWLRGLRQAHSWETWDSSDGRLWLKDSHWPWRDFLRPALQCKPFFLCSLFHEGYTDLEVCWRPQPPLVPLCFLLQMFSLINLLHIWSSDLILASASWRIQANTILQLCLLKFKYSSAFIKFVL